MYIKPQNKELFFFEHDAWGLAGRWFVAPLFYEDPPFIAYFLIFQILSNTPSLFLCHLNMSSCHISCVILLSDIMDLHLTSLGTLVPATRCCVFYTPRNQIYGMFDTNDIVIASTLIWYHTHRETHKGHTGTNRLTHINLY